ncbi:hypothetical protein FKM82_024524 [Ascaphus truei]
MFTKQCYSGVPTADTDGIAAFGVSVPASRGRPVSPTPRANKCPPPPRDALGRTAFLIQPRLLCRGSSLPGVHCGGYCIFEPVSAGQQERFIPSRHITPARVSLRSLEAAW